MSCRRKIPCAVCRLPIVDGKDEAILCEGTCQQWYHRGCASLPPERYKELSSTDEPFFCLTCTCLTFKKEMSALSSTVTSLREELQSMSALKIEVTALKESLKAARHELEEAKRPRSHMQPRSYAVATTLNKASGAPKANFTQRTGTNNRHSERPGGSSESSRPRPAATGATTGAANGQTAAGATQGMQPNKVKVEGARRVWGTLRSTTTKSVSTTISKVCGMNPEKVKRKFKKNNSGRIVRWWFVLHDSEKALSEMDAKWDQVHMHTSWKLEPCYMMQLEDATETPPPCPCPCQRYATKSLTQPHQPC